VKGRVLINREKRDGKETVRRIGGSLLRATGGGGGKDPMFLSQGGTLSHVHGVQLLNEGSRGRGRDKGGEGDVCSQYSGKDLTKGNICHHYIRGDTKKKKKKKKKKKRGHGGWVLFTLFGRSWRTGHSGPCSVPLGLLLGPDSTRELIMYSSKDIGKKKKGFGTNFRRGPR